MSHVYKWRKKTDTEDGQQLVEARITNDGSEAYLFNDGAAIRLALYSDIGSGGSGFEDPVSANTVFAGPASGSADAPDFRALVADDIPSLSASKITSGTLAVAQGGTGASTFGGTNTLLYTTAADTLASIVTANSSVLVTNSGGTPSWSNALPAVSGASLTSLNANNISSGTLAVARGGTGVSSFGGTNTLLYTTAANTLASLTTANSSVLVTNSGGTPSWSTTLPAVSGANLTSLNASNISSGTLSDSRLSSNIPRLDGTNSFSGTNTFSHAIVSAGTINNTVIGGTTPASATFTGAQVTGNLTVDGNLTVSGTTITVNTDTLTVEDPLIDLANNNTSHAVDLGFFGKYQPSSTPLYTGLFFDATDSKWKLFSALQTAPTTTVDTGGTGYAAAPLVVGALEASSLALSSPLTSANGGTGLTSFTANRLLYASSTSALAFASKIEISNHPDGYIKTDVFESNIQFYGPYLVYDGNLTIETADGGTLYLISDSGVVDATGSTFIADSLDGDGSLITDLDADELTSGTVATARLPNPTSGNFTANNSADLDTDIESNAVTLSGDAGMVWPLTVRGDGEPSLQLNGAGDWRPDAIARTADTVKVKLTSSDSYATASAATLYGPGFSKTFNIITRTFSPDDIGTVIDWFESDTGLFTDAGSTPVASDGDSIQQWNDLSGGNHHLSQASSGLRPLWKVNRFGSLPSVQFDGTDDSIASSFTLSQPVHIFAVVRWLTFVGNKRMMDGASQNTMSVYAGGTSGSPVLHLYAGGFGPNIATPAIGTAFIVKVVFNGASSKIGINDDSYATGNAGTNSPGGLRLAAFNSGGTDAMHVEYGAVVRYTADVSANEADLVAYLADKYGVSL